MHAITIGDDCFDEEFLVPCHLIREKFDSTLDDLLFCDIEKRELRHHITLVLVVFRIESDKISHSFYTCFFQFFDIYIGGMQE